MAHTPSASFFMRCRISAGLPSAALAAMVAILAAGALACTGDPGPKRLTGPIPASTDALLAELKAHKERVDQATQDLLERVEAFNSTRKEGQRSVQFSEIFSEELNDAQRDVLNEMVSQEKDVSYRSLLERIIADREQVRTLQEKIAQLEQALPDKYVVAKAGDRHQALAMNFLRNEAGVDEAKAKELLSQVDRTDELVPGNKVWFFYDPNQSTFRTYVTMGDAKITPIMVRRAQKKELISERDKALATVSELEQIKSGLQNDIATLQQRKAELETAKTNLESNVAQLSSDLAFKENSLFYHVANEQDLKDQKVLSSVLKRVTDVRGVKYDSALDLRQGTTLTLYPGRFGLEKIDHLRVLPSIYLEGRDFKIDVSEESGTATLTILDSDLFKGKEVLLAVGG